MAQVEQDIIAEGAQIIWILEQSASFEAGTAELCRDFMDQYQSELGYCVGDGQTQPFPGTWDNSPFSTGRGVDVIVTRDDMVIEFVADHGTPEGNDNLSGADILEAVQDVLSEE